MRAVEASAKTREEAIQNALDELGVDMSEVDKIEVIDEGSKGFLGLGARPVKVKLMVEHLPDAPKPQRKPRQDRNQRNDRDGQQRPQRQQRQQRNTNRTDRGSNDAQQQQAQQKKKAASPSRNNDAPRPRKPESTKQMESTDADTITPISDAQGKEAAALLREIIGQMGIQATVEFARTEDGVARLNVASEDGAILIGRKGRNLSAMQYIINRIISRGDAAENTERLVVDVEGYVDRRRESLQAMARGLAQKAKDTQRNMRLKPMSPQERRIVHLALQDDTEVRTFSLGDSLYRSVIISPKNARNDRSRGHRGNRGGRPNNRGRQNNPRDGQRDRRDYAHQQQDSDFDAGTFGD